MFVVTTLVVIFSYCHLKVETEVTTTNCDKMHSLFQSPAIETKHLAFSTGYANSTPHDSVKTSGSICKIEPAGGYNHISAKLK